MFDQVGDHYIADHQRGRTVDVQTFRECADARKFICDGRILHSRLSCSTSRPTRAAILRVILSMIQLGEVIRARWNSSNFPCFLEASAIGNPVPGPGTV